jgi:glycosyltransferase involved in cell wall biosynthesis
MGREVMRPARVVHVITALEQGGAEAMLEKLLLAAVRVDPDVRHVVFSLGGLGVVGARLRSRGVSVVALGIAGPFSLILAMWRLWSYLLSNRVGTVVQTWMYHADLVGGLCARAAGIGRVYWNLRQELRQIEDLRPFSRVIVRLGARLSSRLPDSIVCCAGSARSSHVAFGYDAGKCVVIDNGFDTEVMLRSTDDRKRLRMSFGVSDEEILVGIVGRLDPQKDHETFLRAAERVAAGHANVRFLMVGRGIDTSADIRRSIESKGLANRTCAVGQRGDIPAVMSALDILVVSSRWEGFPNVLGEAMACEVPAATTDVGDARRILGEDRYVVPPGDPVALAGAIGLLCGLSSEARAELGQRLRLRVVEQFGIDATWRRYLLLYMRRE